MSHCLLHQGGERERGRGGGGPGKNVTIHHGVQSEIESAYRKCEAVSGDNFDVLQEPRREVRRENKRDNDGDKVNGDIFQLAR